MDLEQARKEMVAGLSEGKAPAEIEAWDRWYSDLPADLRGKLSLHDLKRLGDCFKSAFKV